MQCQPDSTLAVLAGEICGIRNRRSKFATCIKKGFQKIYISCHLHYLEGHGAVGATHHAQHRPGVVELVAWLLTCA